MCGLAKMWAAWMCLKKTVDEMHNSFLDQSLLSKVGAMQVPVCPSLFGIGRPTQERMLQYADL